MPQEMDVTHLGNIRSVVEMFAALLGILRVPSSPMLQHGTEQQLVALAVSQGHRYNDAGTPHAVCPEHALNLMAAYAHITITYHALVLPPGCSLLPAHTGSSSSSILRAAGMRISIVLITSSSIDSLSQRLGVRLLLEFVAVECISTLIPVIHQRNHHWISGL